MIKEWCARVRWNLASGGVHTLTTFIPKHIPLIEGWKGVGKALRAVLGKIAVLLLGNEPPSSNPQPVTYLLKIITGRMLGFFNKSFSNTRQ